MDLQRVLARAQAQARVRRGRGLGPDKKAQTLLCYTQRL
jgi:hypothetical protein